MSDDTTTTTTSTVPAAPTGATTTARSVAGFLDAVETMEGEGMIVHRPFPVPGIDQIDPFLLLDELGPVQVAAGAAKGAPDHPHRGFETVSYILAGELEHEDSVGNPGVLRAGDVQWMTAGAGVVHSEMPSRRFQEEGGELHGFQIWVNLPAADKLVAPRYQEVPAASIPDVSLDGGRASVKVIAGEVEGVPGAMATHTPIAYLHVVVEPGGSVELPLDPTWNALVYGFGGAATVGTRGDVVHPRQLAALHRDGDHVVLAVAAGAPESFSGLVLAGEPIAEPMVRYGPFVMNTRRQIMEAMDDYESGRLGTIAR